MDKHRSGCKQAEASDVMKARPTVPTQTVVEYYWAAKDQCFSTANAAENASLDASANWKRTGQSFKAFVSGSSQGQGTAVCRNYGTSGAATDAHLFSVNATECTSYTTELATKASMLGKGFKVGGFGPTGVGMCAPV